MKRMYNHFNGQIVFLPIETVSRELDSKLLLALRLLQLNHAVYIGGKYSSTKIAEMLKCGIFVSKDHTELSTSTVKSLVESNVKVVALDEEGLVWHTEAEYLKRIDINNIALYSKIFSWGPKQHEILTNHVGKILGQENVVQSGNPRIELLRQNLRKYQHLEFESTNLSSRRYVLINAAFTAANWNPHLYGSSSYVSHYHKRGRIKSEEDRLFYEGKVKYVSTIMASYLEMVCALAEAFPEVDFILRPHPDEHIETYIDAFEGLENVKVRYDQSVSVWAYGAEAVIFTGCTTGIESWLLDKLVIRFNAFPDSIYEPNLPNQFGLKATSIDDVIVMLKSIINDDAEVVDSSRSRQLLLIKDHLRFVSIEGSESLEIANSLHNLINESQNFKLWKTNYFLSFLVILCSPSNIKIILANIKARFLRGEVISARRRKLSSLSKDFFQIKINNFAKAGIVSEDLIRGLVIVKINQQGFLIFRLACGLKSK